MKSTSIIHDMHKNQARNTMETNHHMFRKYVTRYGNKHPFYTPLKRRYEPKVYEENLSKVQYNPRMANLLPTAVEYTKVKRSKKSNPHIMIDCLSAVRRSKSTLTKEGKSTPLARLPYKKTILSELRKYKIKRKYDCETIDAKLLNRYIRKVHDYDKNPVIYEKDEYISEKSKRLCINSDFKMYLSNRRGSKNQQL